MTDFFLNFSLLHFSNMPIQSSVTKLRLNNVRSNHFKARKISPLSNYSDVNL